MRSTAAIISLLLLMTACKRPILRGDGSAYTETRPLASFNEVQIWGHFEIVVVKGDSCSIRLEGEKNIIDLVKTGVSSNDLHVRFPLLKDIRPTQRVRCWITVPNIMHITNSGSGTIQTVDTIRAAAFSIHNSGSGRIEIGVVADRLRIGVSGSGTVTIATNGVISGGISGSGNINYKGDPSAVRVGHSGSGRARKVS